MSSGSCAAVLKTASRANPALHLPYRPRLRATLRTASRNYRRYDWSASSGSVVGNDPVNMVDPTGLDTVVVLAGYQLGDGTGIGPYGHAFVIYKDLDTGEIRISRAGPDPAYSGGVSGAVTNSRDGNSVIVAVDTTVGGSVDAGQAGTTVLDSRIVPGAIGDVRANVDTFNERVNDQQIDYQPRGPNSNTYAGDLYENLTGDAPSNNTTVTYPGLTGDLPRQPPPPPPDPCIRNPGRC
jgi:hypothetical protein